MVRQPNQSGRSGRPGRSGAPAQSVQEDGIDDLDVRRVGQGLRTVLMSLGRPVNLGEAVHEADHLQPICAVHVLLARAAGQHDLADEVVDFPDRSRSAALVGSETAEGFGRTCLRRSHAAHPHPRPVLAPG